MSFITIYATDDVHHLDDKRVVLVTQSPDGTIKFQNMSKRKHYHLCDLGSGALIILEKLTEVEGYRLAVGGVSRMDFLDAPAEVQRFIIESGRFPKANWVTSPTSGFYTYESINGSKAYWIRVAEVKPLPGDEND